MDIICIKDKFKKAVNNTEKTTSRQVSLPILKNILLEAKNGELVFSATNLEIGVICSMGVKIKKEGRVVISAKILENFINNLPNINNIHLQLNENKRILVISAGNYKIKINIIDDKEFPIIPKPKKHPQISIPAQEIKEVIPKLLISTANTETRPELSGVNIFFLKNKCYLAATDSFRLSEIEIPVNYYDKSDSYGDNKEKESIIIPSVALGEVFRLIDDNLDRIDLNIENNQIFFNLGGTRIVSRIINGNYPDYKQIIPEKFNTRIVLKRDDILRAIKISSAFTSAQSGEVNISVDSKRGEVKIKSHSEDFGENESILSADVVGPDQEIILNPRYVLDGLNSINSSSTAILVNNDSSPVAIKNIDEKTGEVKAGFVYIIMPIRI